MNYPNLLPTLILAALLAACGGGGSGGGGSPETGDKPRITAVSITQGETVGPYHPLAVPITVTFSEAMDESTLSGAITLSDTAPLAVTITYDEVTHTATLTPDALPLPEGAMLTLTVSTDAKSVIGNPLSDANSTTFETTQKRTVLKTGQTDSNATYDDGYYQKGADRSYSRANDIVTDETTGLMWQDDGTVESGNWTEANTTCNDLTLGGHNDWRLPAVGELQTLVDYSEAGPAVDGIFENMPASHVWSSSSRASSSTNVWYVHFSNSHTKSDNKAVSYAVRCVRGNAPVDNRLIRTEGQTVVDTTTGLIWQDDSTVSADDADTKEWGEAITACDDLSLDGYDDWRLPNINELLSIADYTRSDPAMDPAFENNPVLSNIWSSSSHASDSSDALSMHPSSSETYGFSKTSSRAVRCVHSQ